MEISLYRKTLAALAAGLAGVAAQAVAPVIIGPGIAPAFVALVAALAGVLAVHWTPNTLFGADVNEVAAATFRVAMEVGWDRDAPIDEHPPPG